MVRTKIIVAFLFLTGFSSCYLVDVIKYNAPDADEYKIFSNVVIPKHPSPGFSWVEAIDTNIDHIQVLPTGKTFLSKNECQSLKDYVENSTTLALLIIRNDSILYEKYSKGYGPFYKFPSFSMIKALGIFPMIGIAIKEGFIKSVDDPITDYFPELKPARKFKKITIRHLLNMNSGIYEFPIVQAPWSPQLRYYYGHHLEREIKKLRVDFPPDKAYRYSVGTNTQLLGFLIERTTGKKLNEYFYEKIWSKIGPEYDAFWSQDRENGNIKAFCCFFANPRDFARLGKLFLNKGKWNGEQIVPEEWIAEITSARNINKKSHRFKLVSRESNGDFQSMHWWVGTKGYNEYKASGFFGQMVELFPDQNTMIITFRERQGYIPPEYEVDLFYQIIDQLEALKH